MMKKGKRRGGSVEGKGPKKSDQAIEKLGKEVEEYKDQVVRLQADFENYRKQLDRERDNFRRNANESLIKEILVVVDDLERALKEVKKTSSNEKSTHGLELIHKNLVKILEEHGLKLIESLGRKFDPYYHEILCQEESVREDNIVLEELQKGYLLNDEVIRHSKVKISKKNQNHEVKNG